MKTPPFLLLAALLFWGWQSGLLIFGTILGVILESSRWIKIRWDFSEEDFRRVWNFCVVLAIAFAAYIYSTDEHGGVGRNTLSGIHTATALLRWLPMILFLFVAAQNFSEAGNIPLAAISFLVLRWRKNGEKKELTDRRVNVSYPYFMVCLFSAGIHANDGARTYFIGLSILCAWALWNLRSRRFNIFIWSGAFFLALALGYGGMRGIGQLAEITQSFNAQWMIRIFRQRTDPTQSITAIGQIGELKLSGAIVVRLQTTNGASPPMYLREASYHSYRSQVWYAGNSQNEFSDLTPETNNGSIYNLLPGKTNAAAVEIACYLNGWNREFNVPEGLLPLPNGVSRLGNLPFVSLVAIKENKTGAVAVSGPGFVIFNAHYGPGATIDSPPNTNWDLNVPTNEIPALEKIAGDLKIAGARDEQKLLAVQQFFAGNFTYRTWQKRDRTSGTNETALAKFLLRTRAGHCEYFATATVLLLRELKIPARYAVGYYVHEANDADHYVVRERDAHAWCLVWNRKENHWEDFDTTPSSWISEEEKHTSLFQKISDFFSWLHFQFSEFRWSQSNVRQYVLWALVPVLVFLLWRIIFRRRKTRREIVKNGAPEIVWPGWDSEFYRVEKILAARGVSRETGETFSAWLERILAGPSSQNLRDPLREILVLHYRHRFDPHGLRADERKSLAQKVDSILPSLVGK